jgi:hypothetical protein
MNTYFLSSIEDTIQWLAAPKQADPREALRDSREREFAERGQQRVAAKEAGSDDLPSQYLHAAEGEPDLAAGLVRQHWAAPYNNDYLVVTFPPNVAFKALDVVALSSKKDLSFDDLKAAAESGDQRIVLEMTQPLALNGKPWLTSIPVSEAKEAGALYLHLFFVAKAHPGKGAIARRVARQKLFDACPEIAQIENPHNEGGVAQAPHPAIPPHKIPREEGGSAKLAITVPQVSASAGASVFERLFLTLGGPNIIWGAAAAPWKAYVVINVKMPPGQKYEQDDYIALAARKPNNALDYITSQYVRNLDQGSYETWTTCNKSINANLTVADLDKLETMYVFYARKVNDDFTIIGDPVSFKQQKHWMTESLPDIGQKRLHEIMIPGAHDAGTFDVMHKGTDTGNNAQTQNLDFPGQLALGIRYFDCRLQNWPKYKQPFYFYHGFARTWTVITDLISALKTFFTDDKSKDIVILDFCRFDGFEQSDYKKLFELFRKDTLLANAMMTPDEAKQLTLNDLVAQGKRLFLLCEDATARADFNLGKSINIDAEWPETDKLSTLETKLDAQVAAHAGSAALWSLQAILTPGYPKSIAPWADEVSLFLHEKVVTDQNWRKNVNVIFCDFAAGADLVHAAKVCNKSRYDPTKGNIFWYEHKGWQTGTGAPSPGVEIGHGGWTKFKSVFASRDGWIYAIDWYGNLNRYHDTHWQNGVPMSLGSSQVISSDNWVQYREVFASSDASGNRLIYAITGDYKSPGTGKLWRWLDTGGNQLGQGTLIEGGWENYKHVFASNDGVIYGIDSEGRLCRWRYKGLTGVISHGWQNYKNAFATSDGVIYGIDWGGNLWWWRDTGGNQLGNGKQIGVNWSDFRMIFATSEGRFYGIKE